MSTKKHQELLQKEKWIIEGYVDGAMSDRLKSSDVVIFLDYPGWLCVWRKIKRWFTHRKVSRPELPKEAREEITFKNLRHIFTRQERVPILGAITLAKPKNLIVFYSPAELKKWIYTV